ncbi:MAG TPA: amino acid permease [Bryobacteraceae bacterium]|nr:amino acid permease [Bryobacteraceae bacterium]
MAALPQDENNTTVTGEGLIRAIGPWALGANAVNNTIGAGIFVLPALVASILGPDAVAAYLICGVAIALVLSCFIEIGTLVDRSGGPIAYVEEAFGPLAGFVAWVLYAITTTLVAQAALTTVLLDTASLAFPVFAHGAPRVMAMALWMGALAAVNIMGVRRGMGVAVAATAAKLVPLLFIVLAGAVVMNWRELQWIGRPSAAKLGEASLLLFFAFSGAETVLTPSGEIRDPARTLPRAMFGATACFVLVYVALQVVSQGILGPDLAHETRAPLAAVAGRIVPFGRNLVLAGTLISIAGTTAAGMVALPRAFFLAAENRMLPAPLAAVHPRFRTPHWSIVTVAVSIFALAASGSFRPLAVFSNGARLLMYAAVCIGALRIRMTRARVPGAFRAPGGPLIPVLGAASALWILHYSRWSQFAGLAAVILAAAGYYRWRCGSLSRR